MSEQTFAQAKTAIESAQDAVKAEIDALDSKVVTDFQSEADYSLIARQYDGEVYAARGIKADLLRALEYLVDAAKKAGLAVQFD